MKRFLARSLLFLSLIIPGAQMSAQTINFRNDLPVCCKVFQSLFSELGTVKNARVFVNDHEVHSGNAKIIPAHDGTCRIRIAMNADIVSHIDIPSTEPTRITIPLETVVRSFKRKIPLLLFDYELPSGELMVALAKTGRFELCIHFDYALHPEQDNLSLFGVIDAIEELHDEKRLYVKAPRIRDLPVILATRQVNIHLSEKQD